MCYNGWMLCETVKNGPLSVHRRISITKCNNFLSFCCLSTVVLCLFDSSLPDCGCLDGSGIWVIVPNRTACGGGWCMVNDTFDSIG